MQLKFPWVTWDPGPVPLHSGGHCSELTAFYCKSIDSIDGDILNKSYHVIGVILCPAFFT